MYCRFCGIEGKGSSHDDCAGRGIKFSKRYCECCGAELPELSNGKPNTGSLCSTCIPSGLEYWEYIARMRKVVFFNQDKVNVLYECACKGGKKINHHFDYSRPFDVIRLCHKCHQKEHSRLRRLAAQAAEA